MDILQEPSYGLNVVFPANLYVEALPPTSVMVFGDGTVGGSSGLDEVVSVVPS